ncbi:MAG: LytTR family DNA-binding domain-containing protein [Reichenbachiella sp.]|uniref:LytR/AlgR family response regulator transcription factor n=1 Tax=Reichenbachiella sp. TaxID=2184521 RepID=UPI002965E82F|nr:LytTR family DNA-binding domain-containing protein [Reichenbachiella sp.]MDW3210304.1 LytTR family DNA-binding domain-containing protein [Reichenbachiella sp.]
MLTAVIIEDENHCIERLKRALEKSSNKIKIIGEFDNIKDSSENLPKLAPDLIFLDVELKDGSCFDLLQNLENISFDVIFITAHNEYAVKAFEYSAVHYLLKPVDFDDVEIALKRSLQNKKIRDTDSRLATLIHNQETLSSSEKKLIISSTNERLCFKMGEILRFEGAGNYCTIILFNGDKHLITKTLKHYDDLLEDFYQIHQSHLVNMDHVKKFVKRKNSSFVLLTNNEKIPVSVRRRSGLDRFFDKELI